MWTQRDEVWEVKMKKAGVIVTLVVLIATSFAVLTVLPENVKAATLYVGGGGPGNYTTIQDAIDFANPGDTIFVFSGTYVEQVSVYKSLTLVGEDRNTTIVDGDMIGDVIRITSDLVSISGFTLTNGGLDFHNGDVHLLNVQNSNITDNNMGSSFGSGIVLEDSDNNIIEGNIVDEHGWSGIELLSSHGNAITNNTLTSNYMHGLVLSSSNSNYIIDNAISASEWGIYVEFSLGNTFHGNEMVDTGFIFYASWATVEYYNTHTISTSNTVNGEPVYYWKDADGGRIPSGAGQVILANCTNVIVENQNVSHSTLGIQLGFSFNNTIANNTASHGGVGIQLEHSRDNLIVNNTANDNIRHGTGTWFGLYMRFSDNNTMIRNTASDNIYGITIHDSSGNTVSNNTVSKNSEGITLWFSAGTVVFENAVSSNGVGVYSNFGVNRIFHNNFTGNTMGAMQNGGAGIWDDGYPSGGNYWSDYTGVDNYSGPNQDQPGSDGIGDTPYPIESGGQDDYPLMSPTTPIPPRPPRMTQAFVSGNGLENVTLTWDLSPDDGTGLRSVVGYEIYRNVTYGTNGLGYGLIAFAANRTSVYVDSNSGEGNPSDYFYQVCAIDLYNNSSCSPNQAAKITCPLAQGPNLISIPLIQSDESVETVLQTVRYDKAWFYDSSSQEWEWFTTSKEYRRGLFNIDHTMGLWVNVTHDSNLTVAGIIPAQTTIHLHQGWNLVSFPSFNSSYTVAGLAEIGATRVEGYDSAPPYFLRVLGGMEVLQAGYGYWVRVDADTDWIVEVS